MAGQFHVRQVLRSLDGPLLVQYFAERRALPEVQAQIHSLEDKSGVWDLVPDDQRNGVEADLRKVFDLADDRGIASLYDEAAFHKMDLHSLIDDLDGLENKALAALLTNEGVFDK